GLEDAVQYKGNDDRAKCGEIEPAEADRRDPTELADVAAHLERAKGYRRDDQRDDDHPDRLDEGGADRLQGRRRLRPEQRQEQAQHQASEHLQRQGKTDPAAGSAGAVHVPPLLQYPTSTLQDWPRSAANVEPLGSKRTVVPAKAGTHSSGVSNAEEWVPASAG